MQDIQKILKKAKTDKQILAVLQFGSSLSSKNHRDIDVCLVMQKKEPNINISKKKLSYQKLSNKIDLQVFQQLPLYVKKEILNKNKILLSKNKDKLFDLARETIKEYDYYQKYYLDYMEYLKHGTKAKAIV